MRIPSYLLLLAMTVAFVNTTAQTRKLDSLKQVLALHANDTTGINTLNEIALELNTNKKYDSSLLVASNAWKLSQKLNLKKGIAAAHYNMGRTYYFQKKPALAIENLQKALALWTTLQNRERMARCNYVLAMTSANGEEVKFYYVALKLYEELGDKGNTGNCLYMISVSNNDAGDHPEAFRNLTEAIKDAKAVKDSSLLASCLVGMAEEYFALRNYPMALKNYQESLKLSLRINDGSDPWKIPWSNMGIAACYKIMGDAASNHDTAMNYYNKAMASSFVARNGFDSIGDPYRVAECNNIAGSIFTRLKNYAKANESFNKSLPYLLKDHEYKVLSETYGDIANLDSSQGHYAQALVDYKLAVAYRDSFGNKQYSNKLVANKMQYEYDKKETVAKTTQDKKDAEAKRARQQQFFLLALLGVLVLAGIIIGIIQFRNNKHKQKANLLLQRQKQTIESSLLNLKAAQVQLVQSEKMASLGELTAGIAHEIQNPLNFVNNFSEVSSELVAEMNTELDNGDIAAAKNIATDIQTNLEKINQHGKRADAIVKGMLQHSRVSSGQKEATNINDLCDENLRLAYHGFRAKEKGFQAELITAYDPSLQKINIVPQDIARVLLNLCSNAFYAVNEKSKLSPANYAPFVKVTTSKQDHKTIIAIEDNGSGISQQIIGKILQPFFTTKPTGQGTGLGLSLTYDIIKAHGGELTVDSKEGEGTTFRVLLPC